MDYTEYTKKKKLFFWYNRVKFDANWKLFIINDKQQPSTAWQPSDKICYFHSVSKNSRFTFSFAGINSCLLKFLPISKNA